MDIIVFVSIDETKIIDNAILWCESNNITVSKYKMLHSENDFARAIIHGVDFYFNSIEDATAFKLRWG